MQSASEVYLLLRKIDLAFQATQWYNANLADPAIDPAVLDCLTAIQRGDIQAAKRYLHFQMQGCTDNNNNMEAQ